MELTSYGYAMMTISFERINKASEVLVLVVLLVV
jgi:hypothetical protein